MTSSAPDRRHAGLVLLLMGAALGTSACNRPDPTPTVSSVSAPETLTLPANVPMKVGDVRIAAGNIWEAEYTSDGARARKGLTAQLWILTSDSATKRHLRVHPGQAFDVPGARVVVASIEEKAVRLAVDRAQR